MTSSLAVVACVLAVVQPADEGFTEPTDDALRDGRFAAWEGWQLAQQGKLPQAIEAYTNAIDLAPEAITFRRRAEVWAALNELDRAEVDVRHGLALAGNAETDTLVGLYHLQARIAVRRRDVPAAVASLTTALQFEPESEQILLDRSRLLYGLGEYQQAIDDVSLLIELKPEDTVSYKCRAWFWYRLGEQDRVVDDLNEVLRREPASMEILVWRAIQHLKLGERSLALADLNRALAIDPDEEKIQAVLAIAYVARPEDRTPENSQRAIDLMNSVCESSEEPVYLQHRAIIVGAAGDWERAVQLQQEAVRLAPAESKLKAGMVLWRLTRRECLIDERVLQLRFQLW